MKTSVILLILLFLTVSLFHFIPTVSYERILVPEEVYVGKACDCRCILDARPWYSKINYWFWSFILIAPILTLSVSPTSPIWHQIFRTLIGIISCYILSILALNLEMAIRKGPFVVYDFVPFQKTMDMVSCIGGSGTGARVFIRFIGWFYAIAYMGFWGIIWHQYHKNKTKLIQSNFRYDLFHKIFFGISIPIIILMSVFFIFVSFMLFLT